MSTQQVSAAQSQVTRPIAGFTPSLWGDMFLINSDSDDHEMIYEKRQEVEELKKQVRKELLACSDQPLRQLKLIDEVQRLGVAYYFEKEIQQALHHIYTSYHYHDDENLYNASLCFRLLRSNGYNVTSEIFNKFKDDEGNFKNCSLVSDVPSLLGFYEAAQWSFNGEDLLDEALAFTTTHLQSIKLSSVKCDYLAAQIQHSLKQQLRKGIPRLEAKRYMSIYKDIDSHNQVLLKLAKLDFNLVQSLYKKELSILQRWWKDLGLAAKLSFTKDRMVESYLVSMGISCDPQYTNSRRLVAKALAFDTIIDDIYDAYGTLEELTVFTEAFERWDISFMNKLPKYMQPCYQAVLDFYRDLEDEMEKQGTTYRVYYAKEAMKSLVRGYLKEAQWLNQKYIPTIEEHMDVVYIVSVCPLIFTFALVGMSSETVTKETFDWLFTNPKIMKASSVIVKLMNDIAGYEFEQKRGYVVTIVECYMRQYGVSQQKSYEELNKIIVNRWKDINEECTGPNDLPMSILGRFVAFDQLADVLYKDENCFTDNGPVLKDVVTSLLIEAMSI